MAEVSSALLGTSPIFPFFKLPRELRNLVYSYIVVERNGTSTGYEFRDVESMRRKLAVLESNGTSISFEWRDTWPELPSVNTWTSLVSKQFREEYHGEALRYQNTLSLHFRGWELVTWSSPNGTSPSTSLANVQVLTLMMDLASDTMYGWQIVQNRNQPLKSDRFGATLLNDLHLLLPNLQSVNFISRTRDSGPREPRYLSAETLDCATRYVFQDTTMIQLPIAAAIHYQTRQLSLLSRHPMWPLFDRWRIGNDTATYIAYKGTPSTDPFAYRGLDLEVLKEPVNFSAEVEEIMKTMEEAAGRPKKYEEIEQTLAALKVPVDMCTTLAVRRFYEARE